MSLVWKRCAKCGRAQRVAPRQVRCRLLRYGSLSRYCCWGLLRRTDAETQEGDAVQHAEVRPVQATGDGVRGDAPALRKRPHASAQDKARASAAKARSAVEHDTQVLLSRLSEVASLAKRIRAALLSAQAHERRARMSDAEIEADTARHREHWQRVRAGRRRRAIAVKGDL